MLRATTESLPELPPMRSSGPCGSRRRTRFGRRLLYRCHDERYLLAVVWCACASDASSPPALRQHAADSTRTTKTASTAIVRDYDDFLSPRTPSSGKKPFTSPSRVSQPESPRLDPDLDVASPATVLSAAS